MDEASVLEQKPIKHQDDKQHNNYPRELH